MAVPSPNNAWDRLYRALRQVDPNNPEGAWQILMSGTVNTIGGGTGGTSMVDNNPFTPGGTSISPMGGYYGGRQVASGNAAAPALNGSGVLQVDVISGGAGGGGGFATVGVYGSVSVLGTVNIANAHGIFGSVSIQGTVNIAGPVPTQWMISNAAATVFMVANVPPAGRIRVNSWHVVADGTVNITWQSPSGAAISGSMRLLPGAGFAAAAPLGTPILSAAAASGALLLNVAGAGNLGGWITGWIE